MLLCAAVYDMLCFTIIAATEEDAQDEQVITYIYIYIYHIHKYTHVYTIYMYIYNLEDSAGVSPALYMLHVMH
jgi:hypothetical protein